MDEFDRDMLDESLSQAMAVSEAAEAAASAVVNGYGADFIGPDYRTFLNLVIQTLEQAR